MSSHKIRVSTTLQGARAGVISDPTGTGLLAVVESRASGATLIVPHGGAIMAPVQDPVTGATLGLHSTAPRRVRNPQPHSRKFWVSGAAEVAIDQMRRCPPVTRCTNERVGTAGRPTGVDHTLAATPVGGASPLYKRT
jgi:hypothetical protein